MNSIEDIRKKFVNKLLKSIPSYIKPVEYLIEILNISKVSAYHRLNCKISFSYEEVAILSKELNLSLDELIHSESSEKAIFHYPKHVGNDPINTFIDVLSRHYHQLSGEVRFDDRNAVISMNFVWLIFWVGIEHVFKFYYYKWLQQWDPPFAQTRMQDIQIPPAVEEIRIKLCSLMIKINRNTFILDRLVYFNTLKEIEYYYKRNLITKNELLDIINDFEYFINLTKAHASIGTHKGIAHNYYLSQRNIFSNGYSVLCNNSLFSCFFDQSIRPLKTNDQKFCHIHRDWLKSLKKYSIFITESNEELLANFFVKQMKYVECLANNATLEP